MADELTIDSKALIFATLADVYLSSGMVDEAISILKDGLARNPTYTLAKIILGRAYYIKGDTEEAIKILTGVYEEAKDSENENLYLGRCYRKLGEYEKAIKYYEIVLKINPQNSDAKQELEMLKPTPPVEAKVEKPVVEAPAKKEEVVVKKPVEKIEKIEIIERPAEKLEEIKAEAPVEKFEKIEPEKPLEIVRPEEIIVKEEKIPKKVVPEDVGIPREIGLEELKVPSAEAVEPTKEEKIEAVVPVAPLDSLTEPINRLLQIKTVKGAFICSRDGLLIQNYYQSRKDIEEVAALIAGIYNETDESFKFLKEGTVEKCIIEKGNETISVITAGDSLLCVITEPEAKPGLIFIYARKIIDEIREILG